MASRMARFSGVAAVDAATLVAGEAIGADPVVVGPPQSQESGSSQMRV
jgi:hypothetical protein